MKRITTILWSALCLSFLVCLPSFGQAKWVEETATYINPNGGFSWKLPDTFKWEAYFSGDDHKTLTFLCKDLLLRGYISVDDSIPKMVKPDIWDSTKEEQRLDTIWGEENKPEKVMLNTTTKSYLGGLHAEKSVWFPIERGDKMLMGVSMYANHGNKHIRVCLILPYNIRQDLLKRGFKDEDFFKDFVFDK